MAVSANVSGYLNKPPTQRYIKVSVVNGASNMTYLRVLTRFSTFDQINEVFINDSSGNSISTTSGSINANITNSLTVADSTVATNTSSIVTNTTGIAANLVSTATNTGTIATNTGTIATNTGTIATNTTGLYNCVNSSNQLKVNDYDVLGNRAQNNVFGDRRITEVTKLVGEQFDNNVLDTNYWSEYTINSGLNTMNNAELWMFSGRGTANSQAVIRTINKARFIGQHLNILRAIVYTGDQGYVNCTRSWGCCDVLAGTLIRNGCFFQFSGSTLSAVYRCNNVSTTYNLSSIDMTIPDRKSVV
jgi:hypothetical protein